MDEGGLTTRFADQQAYEDGDYDPDNADCD